MKRTALAIVMVLLTGGATTEAAIAPSNPAVTAKNSENKPKVKKRRGFKRMFNKSLAFVAESAVTGGMSDR